MDSIHVIEIAVNAFLQSLGLWLRAPMQAITTLGYEQFFILLLPAIYWCIDQMAGFRVGLIFILGNFVNNLFKWVLRSPRPYWISEKVQPLSQETSFGLPSGHAQTAATMWGWLAVEIKRRWFTILALVLTFLIGVSRIYLGVHFLTDVLLGWLLGALLVWAFAAWHKPVGKWLSRRTYQARLGLVLASAIVLMAITLGVHWIAGPWELMPAWIPLAGEVDPYNLEGPFTLGGIWVGMLGGFVILTETAGYFSAEKGGWRRIVRFLVGLVGILLLYLGLGQLFPSGATFLALALRFLRYTLIGLWVSWLGPLVFAKLGLLAFEGKVESEHLVQD